jgi:hypothetical protein
MATTGTTAFNLDFSEIAEEAFERAGRELRTGYDLKTARRSMNLLTIEWQNRGLNLWTIDSGEITLTRGTESYALPADTVDLIEQGIRTSEGTLQTDLHMPRISVSTYSSIPNKLALGRPTQIYVDRQRDNPVAYLYPTPDKDTYTMYYWRMRRIQDAGNGVETADINFRFLPCLVAGLAYYIAMKLPESAERLPMLKADYEEQYRMAAEEDREKASVRFAPRFR